ncbi:lysophospholipase [Shewanella abyssi]|uniref:alpha/beta hydrolase n=1 Tax=Shewanella abyssi TaxID=311789 RepID=UPI00200D85A3|nr:alpha/beta hydrolase [Shewanella abyssi]MCL1049650.1 lysophospholipase [Shewanella abyssi]
MERAAKYVTLFLGLLMLSACQSISVTEEHFLYPDDSISQADVDTWGRQQALEFISISATDGTRLKGALITQPNARFTLIYFGGNQFRFESQGGALAKILSQFDNNLLIMDHRGYGMSEGIPSISALQTDASDIYDYVKSAPSLAKLPVIAHGISLGSMIAGSLADQRPVDGLVLEGSTTTAKAMIDAQVPWYAMPFIELDISDELAKIDNLANIESYSGELLVMVGENDRTTPVSLSKTLYESAATPNKQLFIAPGKGHGNAIKSELFSVHYKAFIEKVLLADKAETL